MGQKHKRFREFWTPFLLRVIRKNPRSMYARVSKVMAQFVLKIEKLSHIMGPTPILEMARAYGLRPRLWLLVFIIDSDSEYCDMCTTCSTFAKTIHFWKLLYQKLMQQLFTYIDREARVSQQKMGTAQIISLAFISNEF